MAESGIIGYTTIPVGTLVVQKYIQSGKAD